MDKIDTAEKLPKKYSVFSPPGNVAITYKDLGDKENVRLHNLPRNQIIANMTIAVAGTSAPTAAGQRKLNCIIWSTKICLIPLKSWSTL